MTLSEAYIELQKGNKLTYPGLGGYVTLKDGKLVTELDFKTANERKDWKVAEESKKVTEDKTKTKQTQSGKSNYSIREVSWDEFNNYINEFLEDFKRGFRF